MDIPEQIAKKVRPFFLSFLQKLSDDLNTLIDAPVECALTSISLVRGTDDLDELFVSENSTAYALEDGLHSGNLHLVMDASVAIGLSGLMMMLPKAVVQKSVKTREYTEEIQEGFHEVSNQIMGSLNTRVEEKLEGGHLFLEGTEHTGASSIPSTLNPVFTYLSIGMDVTVSDFRVAPAVWLFSRGFANTLLKVEIPATPEELALEAGGAVAEEPAPEPPPPAREPDDYEFDSAAGDLLARSTGDDLPAPDEPGGLRVVMTLPPVSLHETEEVMQAVVAIFQEGHRYVGVERQGALFRVVSKSDLRRIMGAFYGSKAVTPKEKALFSLPVGKLNEKQTLVRIMARGTINEAADLLKTHSLYALPVVSGNGVLRGFIPVHSLVDYFRKKA
ncbi:MAG: hypothetical protein H7836_01115 [Magnetococcus sp. YQC-3]